MVMGMVNDPIIQNNGWPKPLPMRAWLVHFASGWLGGTALIIAEDEQKACKAAAEFVSANRLSLRSNTRELVAITPSQLTEINIQSPGAVLISNGDY